MVKVTHSMAHLLDAVAPPTYTRYTEVALTHAVTVHPHAVYHALLLALVAPSALSSLQPQHAKLIDVCCSHNTARADLSQQLAITLATSITANAQHTTTPTTPPVKPSLTSVGVPADCRQPGSTCPLSPPLTAAVVSLLCAVAALPTFAEQDK